MIVYRHKETGHVVTMEELKKHMERDIITFQKVDRLRPFSLEEDLKPIERYTYDIKNIPFSDDFEAFELEEELTFNEMSYLIHLLRNERDFSNCAEKLMTKIKTKMNKLINIERGL